jgi:hypothetical protein
MFRGEEHAFHVDLHDTAPGIRIFLDYAAFAGDADVVIQEIQPSELSEGNFDHRPALRLVDHVRAMGQRDAALLLDHLRCSLREIALHVHHQNTRASPREQNRRRPAIADPVACGAGARHDSRLSLEAKVLRYLVWHIGSREKMVRLPQSRMYWGHHPATIVAPGFTCRFAATLSSAFGLPAGARMEVIGCLGVVLAPACGSKDMRFFTALGRNEPISNGRSRPTASVLLDSQFAHATESGDKIARLGFVGTESLSRGVPAFWERLRELGWVEEKNLVTEMRWVDGRVDRLPALMNEVLARKVDVLFTYGTPVALAAKKATTTVPIVAAMMGDPIGTGLVTSLARPGANLTGVSLAMSEGLGGKWMQLLHETVPRLVTVQ